ncbi:MAG TPA: sodium:solute symporter family protein [Clostridia bacterium]|nr:sodium:solute symporter family protein [Clostridia bacterium]
MNNTILIIVLAVYFLAMVGIGWVGKKKYGNSFDNSISAGRNVGVMLFIGAAVGTHIGNGFVVGGTAGGAAAGLGGIWYGIVCALTYFILAITVNKRIFEKGYISLPEFLEEKYSSKLPSLIFSFTTVIGLIGNIGVQIMAGKALFMALGLNGNLGAVIITLVVFAYSALSGLWGAYATSVVQVVIIIAGLVGTTIALLANGGVAAITSAVASGAVPAEYLDPFAGGVKPIFMMLIPITLALIADQGTVQRINSSRSASVAFKGFMLSFLIMIPVAFMPAFIGMYGATVLNVNDNSTFFAVAMHALNPWLAAVLIAAVIAAIMSTIDSLVVAITTISLHNIYRGMINPKVSDKTLSIADKVVTGIVCLVGLLVAISFTNIIGLLVGMCAFIAACCFAPFMGTLYWKRGTTQGAVASSIVGFVLVILNWTKILPLPYEEITPIVVSVITYIVVSLVTKEADIAKAKSAAS